MKMNLYEVQKALYLYPFPVLDGSDDRSAIIIVAIKENASIYTLNEWLEKHHFTCLKTSPEMKRAEIRPRGSKYFAFSMLRSYQSNDERKRIDNESKKMDVWIEQMGCLPCDVGITAEEELYDAENNTNVFISVSLTPDDDFYNVTKKSFRDENFDYEFDFLEEYAEMQEAMLSKYYLSFANLNRLIDEKWHQMSDEYFKR